MILTLRKKILNTTYLVLLVLLISISSTSNVQAQEALTLSISPSIFDMSANPGQEWRSSIRVINVNKYELTVYLDVVNFLPQGESGGGKFISTLEGEQNGSTIAEWFTISKEPVTILPEQSVEIPFSVNVPLDSTPGGHFAAILVGTKPTATENGQSRVQTSQMVTSLFFARVAGDVIESGTIREFITTKKYLNSPEATFELRFENKGNVHLKPQGDIRITNMWGEERGVIPINQNSNFGNVLPDTVRKFIFTWKGEWSISDIGRYTAIATLAYGSDGRQFTNSRTSFWVIPYKLILGVLLGLAIFVSIVSWLIRLYIRHMLIMAGIDVNEFKNSKQTNTLAMRYRKHQKIKLHSSIKVAYTNLQQHVLQAKGLSNKYKAAFNYIFQYKLLIIAIVLIVAMIILLVVYVINANTSYRSYEVAYVNSDETVTLTSEDIIYNKLIVERGLQEVEINPNLPKLKIINRSGKPGVGAETRIKLETKGYQVISLAADFSSPQVRTVIVYPTDDEKEALKLSPRIGNALLSVDTEPSNSEVNTITIYIGSDMATN